jgi:hypothetical protein
MKLARMVDLQAQEVATVALVAALVGPVGFRWM